MKWISVDDDRKPDVNEKCLVHSRMTNKHGVVVTNVTKTEYDPRSGTGWPYLAPPWEVTHWMRMPPDPED